MTDRSSTQAGVERLVRMAIDAATSLAEVLDCAYAAAAIGTPELVEAVADRITLEVDSALASASAWQAELTYSKIDAWEQTGHKAKLLAEAWGLIGPLLAHQPAASPSATGRTGSRRSARSG